MDAYDCNDCGLRWGPEGSHPPCLELPPDERRALYDEIRKRPVTPPEERSRLRG